MGNNTLDDLSKKIDKNSEQITQIQTRCALQHNVNLAEKIATLGVKLDNIHESLKTVKSDCDGNKSDIYELSGKINQLTMNLAELTATKIKKEDSKSQIWIQIISTVISALILSLIFYFISMHYNYQQRIQQEIINNNSSGSAVQVQHNK